ncbi:serine/threonine protein kinase [Streptomyces profundus]|uniref:serine/threonine protein kinase n=1 Tax=Streptomyces profundus TaxID=2867410 RepID=UPI001D1636A9|nr:serine/threonine-protein kinase [Streptomyces sp. MA3_2.13]
MADGLAGHGDAAAWQAPPPGALREWDPRDISGYQLRGRLGSGGMGAVYLSETRGGQPIALKVVHPDLAEDPQFRRRFEREVRAARRVRGRYIAPVADSNTEGPTPWLATEYVPGPSLHQVLNVVGERLAPHVVLRLVAGIASALTTIHEEGMVHRDLKPGNVMLAADGPIVIDFGVARAADASMLTGTRTRIGTPGFMAPEQVRGGEITSATDIFALGLTAHVSATGSHPFGEGTPDALLYRIAHTHADLTACPPGLRRLIEPCLRHEAADRPSARELLALCRELGAEMGLDDVLPTAGWLSHPSPPTPPTPATPPAQVRPVAPHPPAPAPVPAPQYGVVPTPPPPSAGARRRRTWLIAIPALVLVLAVGVGIVVVNTGGDGSDEPDFHVGDLVVAYDEFQYDVASATLTSDTRAEVDVLWQYREEGVDEWTRSHEETVSITPNEEVQLSHNFAAKACETTFKAEIKHEGVTIGSPEAIECTRDDTGSDDTELDDTGSDEVWPDDTELDDTEPGGAGWALHIADFVVAYDDVRYDVAWATLTSDIWTEVDVIWLYHEEGEDVWMLVHEETVSVTPDEEVQLSYAFESLPCGTTFKVEIQHEGTTVDEAEAMESDTC